MTVGERNATEPLLAAPLSFLQMHRNADDATKKDWAHAGNTIIPIARGLPGGPEMKIVVVDMSCVGLANALLLAKHNEVVALDGAD